MGGSDGPVPLRPKFDGCGKDEIIAMYMNV